LGKLKGGEVAQAAKPVRKSFKSSPQKRGIRALFSLTCNTDTHPDTHNGVDGNVCAF